MQQGAPVDAEFATVEKSLPVMRKIAILVYNTEGGLKMVYDEGVCPYCGTAFKKYYPGGYTWWKRLFLLHRYWCPNCGEKRGW